MREPRESRRVWWITGGILALLVGWRLVPEVGNPLAPEPVAAHVALLAEGDAVASDGPHRLDAGRAFRLFAVLEARDWRGRAVYFTEAPALRLGDREIATGALSPWSGGAVVRVRWLTLEGFAPYLAVTAGADLERFRIVESFHPEWGDGWRAEGVVDPRLVQLEPGSPLAPLAFGTQRYAVRIELFETAEELTPRSRASSPGADAAQAGAPGLTRVVAELPPPLARVSGSFGRSEVEPAPDLAEELAAGVRALEDRDLAFTRPRLLAAHLAAAGVEPAALAWRAVDLAGERPAWGGEAAPGDLIQAGPRVVILFRDQGEANRLDPEDLVFDLWRGLHVRRIGDIFRGGEGLQVELARLAAASRPAG